MSIDEEAWRDHVVPLRRVADTDNVRPEIRMTADLHLSVDAAVDVLRHDLAVFHRDGHLVHHVRTDATEADDSLLEGTPQIRIMAAATLRERLTGLAKFTKYDARKLQKKDAKPADAWVHSVPSDHVVSAVIARGMWPSVRALVGLLEAPSLRPDGSIIDKPGFDHATGFVLVSSDVFPAIPEAPTQEDAARALGELEEVFCDFPYARPEHRSAVLASLLTILARPAIAGSVPAIVFDASTRGSGKSLQADAVSMIATGRGTSKMSYPPDDAELEKVLAAYALRAATIVNFDNVVRAFGGGPLDRCLTAVDTVELRILGKSEVPSLRWRAVVMCTGNNVALIGDTARRVMISRIESLLESPEDRTDFKHPQLLEWVRAERPRLVAAALTILRAYVVAGKPALSRPWGSFEAWAALIPGALVYAGAADPQLARPAADGEEDVEKAALTTVLNHWNRLDSDGKGLTSKGAIGALYPNGKQPSADRAPDGFDDLREAVEALTAPKDGKAPTANALSYALRRFKARTVGGKRMQSKFAHGGAQKWSVVSSRSHKSGEDGDHGEDVHNPSRGECSKAFQGATAETSSPSSTSSPEAQGCFDDLIEGAS